MTRLVALLAFAASALATEVGSRVCASCHREIYSSYSQTPMARTSGEVDARTSRPAEFAAGGFRYRISSEPAGLFATFGESRRWPLRYFTGSGAHARSYALVDDGFLYEAPVTLYSPGDKWAASPGYERHAYPYLTRPILPACLSCHASFLQPVRNTQNQYSAKPFGEAGIACERCHGDGERHAKSARAADIVNPRKLDADRRDSICAQCHLSGEMRVMRPGADWSTYRPGDRLLDSITVFVQAGDARHRVTSHVENLAQSACKQAAGDRMWCGSCHDPHRQTQPVSYREKCLGCHETGSCKETRAVRAKKQDNCVSCHMPKGEVVDAQHVVYTDHSIPRRPRPVVPTSAGKLVPFGGGEASRRDSALAQAIAATRGQDSSQKAEAQSLLERVVAEAPDDVEILLYLAELYRNGGQGRKALPLYERAIRLDPGQVTGSVGLGAIRLQMGQPREAIRLWEDALRKNNGLVLVRMNLAGALWKLGDLAAAEKHLDKAVELSPGFAAPREMLERLRRAK